MSVERAALAVAILAAACQSRTNAPPPGTIDAHVHLTSLEFTGALVRALDRHEIERAVVVSSPHLTLGETRKFAGYPDANERVLEAARAHPKRLIPFITVDLGKTSIAAVKRWLERGACGVKLYHGHRAFHTRPLDDPSHLPLFELLEREQVPVLLHVNTVRFRDELVRLARRFDRLRLVCPHLCGSRTDLDRLEGLLSELPGLLVDTSHGPGTHGIAGFVNLDAERDRLRALIEREPTRFLFGSDVVANHSTDDDGSEWDPQFTANKALLTDRAFRYLAPGRRSERSYRGLALPRPIRDRVLSGNARRWLAPCLSDPPDAAGS